MILIFLVSCGINDPDEKQGQNRIDPENFKSVHLEYNGIIPTENGQMASFSMVNDSTHAIQYFAYSEEYPLYSAEALTDTGWTNLMWGWCGTGAEFYPLEPNSTIDFLGMLPTYSCTWRLVLDITDMDSVSSHRLRSENIIYTIPQN